MPDDTLDPHYSLLRERIKQFRELHPTEIEIPEFCNWLLGYLDGFEMAVRDAVLVQNSVPEKPKD